MNLKELWDKNKFSVDRIYYGLIYDVAYYLKELMKQKGLTKKELAKKMNVSPAYITKIFSGDCNISLKTIAKVLSALQIDGTIKIINKSEINLKNNHHYEHINACTD